MDFPKVDKVKYTPTIDNLFSQVVQRKPNMSESLVQELLQQSGFQSNDQNVYKLMAHFVDKWTVDLTDSMIQKNVQEKSRKKDKNTKDGQREEKIQLTTQDIVNELEQKGVKLMNPFVYPQIDPIHIDKLQQS